jgi:hypothetical protein
MHVRRHRSFYEPEPETGKPMTVADPDPRSGMERNPDPRSGMNIQDHFSDSFGLRILKFFYADPDQGSGIFDPGSGMEKFRSGIRHKHPGYATLVKPVF